VFEISSPRALRTTGIGHDSWYELAQGRSRWRAVALRHLTSPDKTKVSGSYNQWMATQQDAAAAAELIGMLKLASFDGLQKKNVPAAQTSQRARCTTAVTACSCCRRIRDRPNAQLPIKPDAIHHIQEKRSRSSAVHAAVLAADDTKFMDYSPSMPVIHTKVRPAMCA
jgi:hypothetical protein